MALGWRDVQKREGEHTAYEQHRAYEQRRVYEERAVYHKKEAEAPWTQVQDLRYVLSFQSRGGIPYEILLQGQTVGVA